MAQPLRDSPLRLHGLSHAYSAHRAAELLDRPLAALRMVTCHLGAGASLVAVVDGRSVETTPLEGIVMATRCGSIDPGLVLWLEEHEHLSPHEVATALEQRSGLTALAGTGDMREVEAQQITVIRPRCSPSTSISTGWWAASAR